MKIYDILMAEDIVKSINDNETILLNYIPELKSMFYFEHNHPHHHLNVWNHTLLALSKSNMDFEIRLSLLLHDIGKPFCYQEDNGIRHFKGHNIESYKISKIILDRLGYDENIKNRVLYLILNHDVPINVNDITNNYELTLKRYEVQRCDALAHNPLKLEKRIKYLEDTKELILKNKTK